MRSVSRSNPSPRAEHGRVLAVFSLLAGLQVALPATADSDAATSLRTRVSPHCELVADIRTDETAACWRVECAKEAPRELACDVTALHQIASIEAAPDRHSLAVISVGEGHPIVEIVPLEPLLTSGRFDVNCSINPFPGSVYAVEWQKEQWRIDSDVDLMQISIEDRANSIDGKSYRYLVGNAGCTLTPVVSP